MRLRRGETVLAAQTPSLLRVRVIICAVLAALSAVPPLLPYGMPDVSLRVRRSSGDADRDVAATRRMNRSSIVWLAARRQGIARCTALHLDCARSPKRGRYRFTREKMW